MGKVIGRGSHRDGLYFLEDFRKYKQLENKMQSTQLVVTSVKDLLWHRRLGHPSFKVFEDLAPLVYKNCNKEMLKCEACELAKHSRTVYPASGNRSLEPFDLIHSDVWGLSIILRLVVVI